LTWQMAHGLGLRSYLMVGSPTLFQSLIFKRKRSCRFVNGDVFITWVIISMESLPIEVQYCLLDSLSEDDPQVVLVLSETCRRLAATVEGWLATNKAGCRLFRGYGASRREIAYLVARPHCELSLYP
jgi:hypothetical protein